MKWNGEETAKSGPKWLKKVSRAGSHCGGRRFESDQVHQKRAIRTGKRPFTWLAVCLYWPARSERKNKKGYRLEVYPLFGSLFHVFNLFRYFLTKAREILK